MKYYFSFLDQNTEIGNQKNDLLGKALSKILPIKKSLIDIHLWKIEFDNELNCVSKEIGFDSVGKIKYLAPTKKEYGFWTDSNMTIDDFEKFTPTPINENEFEKDWDENYK